MNTFNYDQDVYACLYKAIFTVLQSYDEKVNPLANDGYGISKSEGWVY